MARKDAFPQHADQLRLAHFEHAPGAGSEEAWIEQLEALAVRIGAAGGLDPDSASFLGVAVREAIMNALRHGTGPEGPRVTVRIEVAGGRDLVLTVRDHGPGFDPSRLPDPLAPENLCRGCGRGVFYMRQFTDEVVFRFPRRGGTVARLRKRLSH